MKPPSTLQLLLISSFPATIGTIVAPTLPALANLFAHEHQNVQSFMTAYLFGYALGQLLYGPICNRLGLKKVVLGITGLSTLFSILFLVSITFNSFFIALIARFCLALCSSGALKISVSYINKAFPKDQVTKKSALLSVGFSVFPFCGLFLSSTLLDIGGYFYPLSFQVIYALFVCLFFFRLPQEDTSLLTPTPFRSILTLYKDHLLSPKILLIGVLMGLSPACVYIFATIAPFLSFNVLNIPEWQYGLYSAFPSFGMFTGGILGSCINPKFERSTLIWTSLSLGLLIGVLSLGLVTFTPFTPFTLFIPIGLLIATVSILQSNVMGHGLQSGTNQNYTSASLMFYTMFTTVLSLYFVQHFPNDFVPLLSFSYISLSTLGIVIYIFVSRMKSTKLHI